MLCKRAHRLPRVRELLINKIKNNNVYLFTKLTDE